MMVVHTVVGSREVVDIAIAIARINALSSEHSYDVPSIGQSPSFRSIGLRTLIVVILV